MQCATCEEKECYQGKDCTDIKGVVTEKYEDVYSKKVMQVASRIEAQGYMKLTRLEELITFCREMDFHRVGVAFCLGLEDEARTLVDILGKNFQIVSVCCKVCGIDKSKFDLPKLREERYEATCNPIAQALVLNEEAPDLNILFGLCMGHDLLFTKHSKAPVTTLAVKDRVLAHNPVGALTSRYYRTKLLGALRGK